MEKFIPYEKLSKKEKRKLDQAKRQTWNGLSPVTRKPASSKAYNRNKTRDWKRDYHEPIPGSFLCRQKNDSSCTCVPFFFSGIVISSQISKFQIAILKFKDSTK